MPPEPPDTDDSRAAAPPQTPMDDEAMLAEAASMSREHPSRRDPEEVALELLAARRIDEAEQAVITFTLRSPMSAPR